MVNVERRLHDRKELWLHYLICKILLVGSTLRGNEYTNCERLFECSQLQRQKKLMLFSIESPSWFPCMNGLLSPTLHRQSQEI